ncbi:MAG: hypothetical protein RMJ33_06215 [Saprospiraceae bacterium]|nr:hypothetical protein [Saprospiraceae bacterium]MDW8229414.1 hypothetical protein [Saprospiraceae bacterium]
MFIQKKSLVARIGIALLCSLSTLRLSAQMERTVYQIFAVDSIETVVIDMVNFIYPEVHLWAGTSILTEVHVQIWDASPERVDTLISKGRYAFESERQGNTLRIYSKTRRREPIYMFRERQKKQCLEQTVIKVFVPDFYEINPAEWRPDQVDKPKTLRRKTP